MVELLLEVRELYYNIDKYKILCYNIDVCKIWGDLYTFILEPTFAWFFFYYLGGDFMGGYHWEQIVMMLLDKIENMKAHEDEMNHMIDELRTENVRLTQLLREFDEGTK